MNNILIYLVQSGISLALLYSIYWFLMRKDTFFSLNRFYLILSVFLSFTLPLLKPSFSFLGSNSEYIYLLETITITPGTVKESIYGQLSLFQVLGVIYLIGAVIFFMRFVFQLVQIGALIHNYGTSKNEDFHLVITNSRFAPFSFFNIIFLANDIKDQKVIKEIITHEKVHIQQKHSIDIILLEILSIIQWFNPFMWLYKNSIKNIHEFLADEGVLNEGINKVDYQELLINQSIGVQLIGVSNNFSPVRSIWSGGQSIIKRRFIMMSKSKTQKVMLLKMVFILPIALFLSIVFSSIITEKVNAQSDASEINSTAINLNPQEEQVFMEVEKMPEYPGGDEARIKFLVKNIKYPEEARKNGTSGTVYITFIIEKSGEITNVKVLKGVNELLDNEAARVVNLMPAWEPGMLKGKPVRVQFNMPIQFNLDKGAKKKNEDKKASSVPPPPNMIN